MENRRSSARPKTGHYTSDLAGRRFGHLVALKPTDKRKGGFVVWECRCDCGNITYVPSGSLKSGNTASCGKCGLKSGISRKRHRQDQPVLDPMQIQGMQFGRLKAIRFDRMGPAGPDSMDLSKTRIPETITPAEELQADQERRDLMTEVPWWWFHCDCGNDVLLNANEVLNGQKLSCGCLGPGMELKGCRDLAGKRFGRLVALRLEYKDEKQNACWLFHCDCGNEKVLPAIQVTRGNTRSCGCLRHEARGRPRRPVSQQLEASLDAKITDGTDKTEKIITKETDRSEGPDER